MTALFTAAHPFQASQLAQLVWLSALMCSEVIWVENSPLASLQAP